jgi:hypothetical protein
MIKYHGNILKANVNSIFISRNVAIIFNFERVQTKQQAYLYSSNIITCFAWIGNIISYTL